MRRTLSVHPASLVLGAVFGVLVLLSMSQSPPLNANSIGIQYLPHPRDYVQIREGTPYTVPPGKILAVTALGSTDGGGYNPVLRVNGQTELAVVYVFAQNPPSVAPVAPGLTIPAGSVVEVLGGGGSNARAWGFLAAQ